MRAARRRPQRDRCRGRPRSRATTGRASSACSLPDASSQPVDWPRGGEPDRAGHRLERLSRSPAGTRGSPSAAPRCERSFTAREVELPEGRRGGRGRRHRRGVARPAPARASMSSSTWPRSRPTASRPPAATTGSTPRARRRWQRRRSAAGVRRIVHLAGIDTTTGEPGPYLAGRRRGDAAVLASGIESVAILRPSIMFGGRDSAFVKALARLVKLSPAVPVPGDGSVRLQLVWVEDVVRCVMQLADDMRARAVPDRRSGPADLRRGARHHRRGPRQAPRAQGAPAAAGLRGAGAGCCPCCPARRSRRPRSSCSRATTRRRPTRSSSSSTSGRAASRSTCAARASSTSVDSARPARPGSPRSTRRRGVPCAG